MRGFIGGVGGKLDNTVGLLANAGNQGVELGAGIENVFEDFNAAGGEGVGLIDAEQTESGEAMDDDGLIAVGELEELENGGGDADGVEVGIGGLFGVTVFLGRRRSFFRRA